MSSASLDSVQTAHPAAVDDPSRAARNKFGADIKEFSGDRLAVYIFHPAKTETFGVQRDFGLPDEGERSDYLMTHIVKVQDVLTYLKSVNAVFQRLPSWLLRALEKKPSERNSVVKLLEKLEYTWYAALDEYLQEWNIHGVKIHKIKLPEQAPKDRELASEKLTVVWSKKQSNSIGDTSYSYRATGKITSEGKSSVYTKLYRRSRQGPGKLTLMDETAIDPRSSTYPMSAILRNVLRSGMYCGPDALESVKPLSVADTTIVTTRGE
ncbi:hypothetical protein QFC21_004568 [Naganishia friedmannii]|uniref:Uncharacterized protein n=1 Tax=Naganishia friedmannii TaxID=89922 RepID=A0ACC2VGF0_9TREE|nr:hypothetical protein QFC21_004568 [Naganishia friedmannii]